MVRFEFMARLRYADLAAMPNDPLRPERRELLDGELIVTPSPLVRHQRVAFRLARALADFVEPHGLGEVFVPPMDVVLADGDVVQPDVFLVLAAQAGIVTRANIAGAPALVVEVVSDPRVDRVRKRDVYARHGVSEYWIADPDADRIEVHRHDGAGYPTPVIVEVPGGLSTPLLPGFELDLAAVFAR